MHPDNLTHKALESLQSAHSLAVQHKHTQVEPVHLCLAVLSQHDGIVPSILHHHQKDVVTIIAQQRPQ